MRTSRVSNARLEQFVLAIALLAPLAVALLALAQLPSINLGLPSTFVYADAASSPVVMRHIASSRPAAPPTLAPPQPTPPPTSAPRSASTVVPTPAAARTYTVKAGDELRHIAADYDVSIWKIIDNNDIPNPDSLRVGQVLKIPDN